MVRVRHKPCGSILAVATSPATCTCGVLTVLQPTTGAYQASGHEPGEIEVQYEDGGPWVT